MNKKTNENEINNNLLKNVFIKNAGEIEVQLVEQTLEKNYMPYAMSVILSRALPQIDGFKPSHRKLLYTMFKMGLLTGKLTKSANVVGATMKLNPHGDSAIYETMVRLSRGNGALLHPYVDSKGNFGKFFSRDMDCAASRYTEVKLAPICQELFDEINFDSVDFVSSYDGTTTEPMLLPVKFPSILVNSNVGIAVSMASAICPFNLVEVCKTAIKIIKGQKFNLMSILKGPDFPGGGLIVKNEQELQKIYETGKGSIQIRSVFNFDKKNNCIEVVEIPYTTTVEVIIEKIVSLIKIGKLKEISDVRDETDLKGLKIAIDLKRGAVFENVIKKLLKLTPLQDVYSCNFNVLVNLTPKVMGVVEIIKQWQSFRQNCVRRRVNFELNKKEQNLHLIKGLNKILLDLDKVIEIIRHTEKENDVIFNLMKNFDVDRKQAEYICEIKLKHLNRQYVLNKVNEKNKLENEIEKLKKIFNSEEKINEIICLELNEIAKKYGCERKTKFIENGSENDYENELVLQNLENYATKLILTKQGYVKKIPITSFKNTHQQKLKEGDCVVETLNLNNLTNLLFFTNKAHVYLTNVADFKISKSSSLGEFVAAKLGFEKNEILFKLISTENYEGEVLFFFEDGRLSKVNLKTFKTNRKKLSGAFSTQSNLCNIFLVEQNSNEQFVLISSDNRWLVIDSNKISLKTTRNCKGVKLIKLKNNQILKQVKKLSEVNLKFVEKFKSKNFPASGKKPSNEDLGLQLNLN